MSEAPEGMVSVEEFAKSKGTTPLKIIEMIRDGSYIGRKVNGSWYINNSELPNSSRANRITTVNKNSSSNEVIVTDIHMPFLSMVSFMVKWAIASIPAIIILFIIFSIVSVIFGGIFTGMFHSTRY